MAMKTARIDGEVDLEALLGCRMKVADAEVVGWFAVNCNTARSYHLYHDLQAYIAIRRSDVDSVVNKQNSSWLPSQRRRTVPIPNGDKQIRGAYFTALAVFKERLKS